MNDKTAAGAAPTSAAGASSRPPGTPAPSEERLGKLRFVVQARLARGSMTVGQLLGMKPGTVIRSGGSPGDRVTLCCGRVVLGVAEPVVVEEKLALRVHSLEQTPAPEAPSERTAPAGVAGAAGPSGRAGGRAR